MKKFLKTHRCLAKSILITSVVLGTGSAMAAPISLINQGFETGDLSGWDTIGQVVAAGPTTVVTNNGTNYLISPNESSMAFMDSFGASVSEIESFFGIASGSFNATQTPFGNSSLTNGSAISQSFVASAGDTIDMSWNYAARDYIPFTDPSFAVLIAPDGTTQIETLASTTGPGLATGSDGISGVFSFAQIFLTRSQRACRHKSEARYISTGIVSGPAALDFCMHLRQSSSSLYERMTHL